MSLPLVKRNEAIHNMLVDLTEFLPQTHTGASTLEQVSKAIIAKMELCEAIGKYTSGGDTISERSAVDADGLLIANIIRCATSFKSAATVTDIADLDAIPNFLKILDDTDVLIADVSKAILDASKSKVIALAAEVQPIAGGAENSRNWLDNASDEAINDDYADLAEYAKDTLLKFPIQDLVHKCDALEKASFRGVGSVVCLLFFPRPAP